MKLTYRTRRRLHKLAVFCGYFLLIGLTVWIAWVVWLERFVVYNADGARIDFDYVRPEGAAVVANPPEEETVSLHYNEGDAMLNTSSDLTRISGYYVTTSMLIESVENVKLAIRDLPAGSAVMLDLKSGFGNFYYSSNLTDAAITDAADVDAIDELIRELTSGDIYVVARIPAFRDRNYGLEHTNYGLPTSGGYLWAGDDNCYWLNPASNGTLTWVISVVNELRDLGFDEVVFTDFAFPPTDNIVFSSSYTREEVLAQAADTIITSCATSRFAVSFETDNRAFILPEGARSRIYLNNVSATGVDAAAEETLLPNKEVGVVFITQTNDTRYDAYSTMRPLNVPEV